VLPRGGQVLSAALTALEVTAILVVGHALAGGELPSLPWVLAMAAVVFGSGLLVLRRGLAARYAVPASVAAQVLLHAWLTWLTPTEALGHGSHVHATFEPRMLAVHVAGALVAALAWHLRGRALDVAVAWITLPRPVAPSRAHAGAGRRPRALAGRALASVAPRRGPPVARCAPSPG